MEHKLSEHSLPAEPLPRSPSIESSISATKSIHIIDDEITRVKDEEELNEKVENLLKKKIQEGDKIALFQLAQFYFEQVISCYCSLFLFPFIIHFYHVYLYLSI